MTITDAKGYFGLLAGCTPTGTNVANTVNVGEALATTSWTDATIAYSFKVAGNAAADVATLTFSSGSVAQTTGTPVITDGDGNDFEGVTLPTLATLYAVAAIVTTADTTSLLIGGDILTNKGGAANDRTLGIWPAGRSISSDTLTLTFGTGDGVAEIVVIGKD